MVEAALGKPNAAERLKQVAQVLSVIPNLGGINRRSEEILASFREEERTRRQKQRIKVLEEAEGRGEIVYTSRIETE